MSISGWLSTVYYELGKQQTDFRICSTYIKDGETRFTKWINYLTAQEDESFLNNANQREQLKNEIIFDYDGSKEGYDYLISLLKEQDIKFYAYSTEENRCKQIHTFWKGLSLVSKSDREKIRKKLLDLYQCDLNFVIDAHVVPIENCIHWKTGKLKQMIESNPGENNAKELINELEVIKQNKKEKQIINNSFLRIDNYIENAKMFYNNQPYFYDKSGIWWIWKDNRWQITDDVEMVRMLDESLGFFGQTVNSTVRNNNLNAMMWVGRENIPKDAPAKWVQFKDKAISITSGDTHNITPDFFFTNPIPFEIGTIEDTPIMDSIFESWVGKDNVQLLYEIIAYCCYTDYPIHRIFCLVGSGSNGKSRFLALIRKFLGEGNFCSTELDSLLDSRFESFKLYKKLCCIIGETNFSVMSKTSILKKLSGQDSVGIEKKGKDPFDMQNYAKLLIASNSLPSSMDTSDGFYRRFLIINFPNQFPEGKDILETIPSIEYNNLCLKIKNLLPKLLNSGKFSNEGNIEAKKLAYIQASNPLSLFIEQYCYLDASGFCLYNELYTKYTQYLLSKKMRKVNNKEFKDILENEGFYIDRTSKKINDEYKNGFFINGLKIKEVCVSCVDYVKISTSKNQYTREVKIDAQSTQNTQKNIQEEQIVEEIPTLPMETLKFDWNHLVFHKCEVEHCNNNDCNFDAAGVPYCEKHWDSMALTNRRS